jgi:hypothetical protein
VTIEARAVSVPPTVNFFRLDQPLSIWLLISDPPAMCCTAGTASAGHCTSACRRPGSTNIEDERLLVIHNPCLPADHLSRSVLAARSPAAWACRNCRQVGPDRRGAGSMPAACRISHTVDGATARPGFVSSPWIRRYPHSGFSFARRTTRPAMPRLSADDRACAACSCRT